MVAWQSPVVLRCVGFVEKGCRVRVRVGGAGKDKVGKETESTTSSFGTGWVDEIVRTWWTQRRRRWKKKGLGFGFGFRTWWTRRR